MPQRPRTIADRLRTAWRRTGDTVPAAGGAQGSRGGDRGNDFADRLRAAVATRR